MIVLISGIKRIGKEIALSLLKENHQVIGLYNKSLDDSLKSFKNFYPLKADLSKDFSLSLIEEEILKNFGKLDSFIHLASPYYKTPIENSYAQDFDNFMNPIAKSFYFLSLKLSKLMNKGKIIAFGEWALDTPYKDYGLYFLAKGALREAVKVLSRELSPDVLVNEIALGPVLCPEDLSDKEWEKIVSSTLLNHEVFMKDIILTVKFLLENDSLTGNTIFLDSGMHLLGVKNY